VFRKGIQGTLVHMLTFFYLGHVWKHSFSKLQFFKY
jgi:hypothetical protein